MRYIPFIIFFINITFLKAQIHAVLIDSITEKPIIHANIKIKNMNAGTISNSEGAFQLENDTVKNGKLIISHIGYDLKKIYLKNLEDTIFLSPKIYKLNEVIVADYSGILKKALNKLAARGKDELFHQMYYKQYLKENKNYVDYLEAIVIKKSNEREIYVESIRSKKDETVNYVDFSYENIYQVFDFFDPLKILKSKILDAKYIDNYIMEFKMEYKTWHILVVVDVKKNQVIQIKHNSINNQLIKTYGKQQKVWVDGKVQTFQVFPQGRSYKTTYGQKEGNQFTEFLAYENRITLKSNKGILITYQSTQILQSLQLTKNSINIKKTKRLKEKKSNNFKSINSKKLIPFSWNEINRISPTKNELSFLDKLKW